jgi:hypothetical protein
MTGDAFNRLWGSDFQKINFFSMQDMRTGDSVIGFERLNPTAMKGF